MNANHEAIKAIWPKAEHITDAGDCDDCGWGNLYFFTLPEFFKVNERGHAEGGFYCADCGFSNAGSYPVELVNGLDYPKKRRKKPNASA